jgi:hypothetical protein
MNCRCIDQLDLATERFIVRDATIHTSVGCFHASLFLGGEGERFIIENARLPASAPPEASGLRASIEQIISDVELKAAMEETRRPGDLTIPNVQRRIVARLRAALAATPDARPDPRAEAFEDAASAVDHMELPQGGNRCEERVVVAAVKLLRSLAALPASPQATTPAPSHDAKE